MDRVIKFRVWDSVMKRYLESDEAQIYIKPYSDLSKHFLQPKILEQFTGFTDCEGKEIYEGDIVQLKGSDYEVYFQKDCGQWLAQDCDGKDNYNTLQLICYLNKCEIVGNIRDKEEAGK